MADPFEANDVTRAEIVTWIKNEHDVRPLFLCISGSHLWNLARPDSDLDIRGIYIDPLDKVLAVYPGRDTIEAIGILGGNIDIQLYEIRKAFHMLRNNNGNIVEMLLGPTKFYDTGDADWKAIAQKCLTKKLAAYYRGYFTSQRHRAGANRGSKALVYTFRECLSGIVLMETGQIIFDFWKLREAFNILHPWDFTLLDTFMKRESWREPVPDENLRRFEAEWDTLATLLDQATRSSSLPDDTDGLPELDRLLWDTRMRMVRL